MRTIYSPEAKKEIQWFADNDKNLAERIYQLVADIKRDPRSGIGKPEILRHNLSGYWSRRIDEKHRMIYRIIDKETVEIVSCYSHYGDNKKHLKRKKL